MHPLLLFSLLFVPGIKCSEGVLQDISNFKRNGGGGYPFSGTDVTPIEEPKTVGVINPSNSDGGQLKHYDTNIAKKIHNYDQLKHNADLRNHHEFLSFQEKDKQGDERQLNNHHDYIGFPLSDLPGFRIKDFQRFQDSILRHLLPKEFEKPLQNVLKCKDADKNIYRSRSNNPRSSKFSEYCTLWKRNEEGKFTPCGYVIRVFQRTSTDPKDIALKIFKSEQSPFKKSSAYKANLNPDMRYKKYFDNNKAPLSTVDRNVSVDQTDKTRPSSDNEKIENKLIRYLKKYPKLGDNKYLFDWIKGKKCSLIERAKVKNLDDAINQRKDLNKMKISSPLLQKLYANNKNSDNQRPIVMDQNAKYHNEISTDDFDTTRMKLSQKNGPIENTFEVNLDIKPLNENSLFEKSDSHSFLRDHADSVMRKDIDSDPVLTPSSTNSHRISHRRISKREMDDDMYIKDKIADASRQNNFRNNYRDSRKYGENFLSESEENKIPDDNLEKWNYNNQNKFRGIYVNPLKEQFIQKHREDKLKTYQSFLDMIKFKNNKKFVGNKDFSTSSKGEPSQTTVDKKLIESSRSENLNIAANNQNSATVKTSDYTKEITNEPSRSVDQTKENSSIKPSIIINRPLTDKEGLFSTTEKKAVQTNAESFGIETNEPETCPHAQELLFWNNIMKNALLMRSAMAQLDEILP